MIFKKKILSNEIIKRDLPINIDKDDIYLFKKDLKKKIRKSFIYKFNRISITQDGMLIASESEILKDFLSFSSLSKSINTKKIILLIYYKIKNIINILFFSKINLNGNFFIIHNRNSEGFFHWITDTLPKLSIAKKHIGKNYILILPSKLKKKFIIDSLKILKVRHIFLKKNFNYIIKNLYYIGELYPSGNPRANIIKNFVKNFKIYKKRKLRIYISRNESERRKISNEKELINVLKKYNFKVVHMENLSLKKQINLSASSEIILGLHGAGLSNILWMGRGSNLIELKPHKDEYLNCYFNLCKILNIKYNYVLCKKNNLLNSSKTSDYNVDVNSLEIKIKKIIK